MGCLALTYARHSRARPFLWDVRVFNPLQIIGDLPEFYRDIVAPMWGRLCRETLKLNDDGRVSAPIVPSIGIEPKEDVLAPYRIA